MQSHLEACFFNLLPKLLTREYCCTDQHSIISPTRKRGHHLGRRFSRRGWRSPSVTTSTNARRRAGECCPERATLAPAGARVRTLLAKPSSTSLLLPAFPFAPFSVMDFTLVIAFDHGGLARSHPRLRVHLQKLGAEAYRLTRTPTRAWSKGTHRAPPRPEFSVIAGLKLSEKLSPDATTSTTLRTCLVGKT